MSDSEIAVFSEDTVLAPDGQACFGKANLFCLLFMAIWVADTCLYPVVFLQEHICSPVPFVDGDSCFARSLKIEPRVADAASETA